jgi:hypothetical protein
VIAITYTIWSLNILSSLISIGFWPYYHSSLVQLYMPDADRLELYFWYSLAFRTFTWTVNFITELSLLYLFLYQGRRAQAQRVSFMLKRGKSKQHTFKKLAQHSLKFDSKIS